MSLQNSSDDKIPVIRTQPDQSLGCSIIDKDGHEVPITEKHDPGRLPRTGKSDWSSLPNKSDVATVFLARLF